MNKVCSFFGHREIKGKENVTEKVVEIVERLIGKGVTVFLFGGFGEFDELCHKAVSFVKERYPSIKRVYCLSEEKYVKGRKRPKYLKVQDYEELIYLPLSFNYWYTRIYYRNCEMIEKSDYVIFYADNRKDSGAYKALQYAMKRKKEYINVFSLKNDGMRDSG